MNTLNELGNFGSVWQRPADCTWVVSIGGKDKKGWGRAAVCGREWLRSQGQQGQQEEER